MSLQLETVPAGWPQKKFNDHEGEVLNTVKVWDGERKKERREEGLDQGQLGRDSVKDKLIK